MPLTVAASVVLLVVTTPTLAAAAGVGPPLVPALVPALTSARATGTAPAGRTTSPAAPAALSVLPSRRKLPSMVALVALMVTCHAQGASASALSVAWVAAWEPAQPVVVPAALAGSLATGFAPGACCLNTVLSFIWVASCS